MAIMDEDPNEIFRQMMEGVELEEPTDAINYSLCTDEELAIHYDRVRRALHEMEGPDGRSGLHTFNANTQEMRDLQSQFSAINHELRRRHKPS